MRGNAGAAVSAFETVTLIESNEHRSSDLKREQWLQARIDLLAREKDLTRLRDAMRAERPALP